MPTDHLIREVRNRIRLVILHFVTRISNALMLKHDPLNESAV